jgi:hypothetical protein
MQTILLIILILLLIGALPTWPYSTGWGYYPFGGIGLILLIVIILAITDCKHLWPICRLLLAPNAAAQRAVIRGG